MASEPARPQAVWLHIDAETALAGPLPPQPAHLTPAALRAAERSLDIEGTDADAVGQADTDHSTDATSDTPSEPASDTCSEPISDAAADVSSRGGTGTR